MKKATFGAGCFWGIEAAFRRVTGVKDTVVGYMGGTLANPTYAEVCTDTTGHAEVVVVTYDPEEVSFDELLDIFWHNHNPTSPTPQGLASGSQYRSAIFVHTPEQETAARAAITHLEQSGRFGHPIITEVTPADTFYRAEEYHQRYLEKRGEMPYGT